MKTRHEILKECPEAFHTQLQDWIDELETEVNSAMNELGSINGISDFAKIVDAHNTLIELSRTLY